MYFVYSRLHLEEGSGRVNTRIWSIAQIAGVLILVISVGFGASNQTILASSSVSYKSESVSYNGKIFEVQMVTVDLKDPYLRVMPIAAEAGVGHVEEFASILSRNDAAAGINGTFFDAYEENTAARYPNGLMIDSGDIVQSGSNQALSVSIDKLPQIEYLKTEMKIFVTHSDAGKYTFSPWGVNKYYGANVLDQVNLYTADFGKSVSFASGTKIVVDEKIIKQITSNAVSIPANGHVIFVGNTDSNQKYIISQLHVGDRVELQASVKTANETLGSENWEAAIGVGPKLLTKGKVDIDFKRDGFTDPKITANANARSFVGVDTSKRLVLGTMTGATAPDMANVLLKLGLTDAMNMDGGASSGLYYEGSMKRKPGRLLSNALVVRRYKEPQVQVSVNGQFIQEFRGYIIKEKTMVPFRGIFERIQAQFIWDGVNRVLTAKKGGTILVLRPGDLIAEVNGQAVSLDVAPTIREGHIYIPLRFAAETLGAKVAWDQSLYRAQLSVE
jgi:exopolysaccharide biosynthesis protein